jgi:hypothetical protein
VSEAQDRARRAINDQRNKDEIKRLARELARVDKDRRPREYARLKAELQAKINRERNR